MPEKIELEKGDLFFTGILCILGCLVTVAWMALTGNSPQTYGDIVIEWTTWVRSNKDTEILLLRLLILLGSAAVVCRCLITRRKPRNRKEDGRKTGSAAALAAWIGTLAALKLLFMQSFSNILFAALFFTLIAFILEREAVATTLCQFFLSYYAFFALYQACRFLTGLAPGGGILLGDCRTFWALAFASASTALALPFRNRRTIQKKASLVLQLLIPALYLILTVDRYAYGEDTVQLGIPLQAKAFVALAVVLSLADAVRTLRKSWGTDRLEVDGFIGLGTCIALMCFNFSCGEGAVVNPDMHHPYENVFAFQQIFELGQVPFKDFIPPAGLYSVVQGACFKLFGNGEMANYALANNIFYYIVIALTIALLQFHLNRSCCLAIALLIQIPDYNRVAFMAPVVLLLLLPRLVQRPGLWLKTFLLASAFHGLYYPVYGVACFVGFIPMAVVQTGRAIHDPARPATKPAFWISWAAVLLVLLASIPLLWGTLIHIKAMAGQSVLADGIAIFGQELPRWFMPYAGDAVRYPLYNAMHVVPLAMMVWLPVLYLCAFVRGSGVTAKALIGEHIQLFTAVASLALIPAVSYTFSFIRLDLTKLFVRSWPSLVCVFVLHAVFAAGQLKDNGARLAALLLLSLIIVPAEGIGLDHARGKMFSRIEVPEGYRQTEDLGYGTVGRCFIEGGVLDRLESGRAVADRLAGRSSFAQFDSFGYWYAYRLKGGANIEGGVMKSYGAAKETKEALLRNRSAAGPVDPVGNYYLYNWLVSSGDYLWDETLEAFVPGEEAAGFEETRRRNLAAPGPREDCDLGNAADVFGLSFASLEQYFTGHELPFSRYDGDSFTAIEFGSPVLGKDIDFVYLAFDGIEDEYDYTEFGFAGEKRKELPAPLARLFLKKRPNPSLRVAVAFYGEDGTRHRVLANYGNGRLLVNLGAGAGYLLERHGRLEISVLRDGVPASQPRLKEIQFLACRRL